MGLFEDPLFIAFDALFAAIMLGTGYFILTALNGTGLFASGFAAEVMSAIISTFSVFDWLLIIGIVMYAITSIALAYFIPSNPIFFVNYFVFLFLAFVVSPQISNLYALIAQNSLVKASFDAFPKTAWVIGNIPLIVVIIMTILAIVMYSKERTDGLNYG